MSDIVVVHIFEFGIVRLQVSRERQKDVGHFQGQPAASTRNRRILDRVRGQIQWGHASTDGRQRSLLVSIYATGCYSITIVRDHICLVDCEKNAMLHVGQVLWPWPKRGVGHEKETIGLSYCVCIKN